MRSNSPRVSGSSRSTSVTSTGVWPFVGPELGLPAPELEQRRPVEQRRDLLGGGQRATHRRRPSRGSSRPGPARCSTSSTPSVTVTRASRCAHPPVHRLGARDTRGLDQHVGGGDREHRQRDHHQHQHRPGAVPQRVAAGQPERQPPGVSPGSTWSPGRAGVHQRLDLVRAGLVDDDAVAQEDHPVRPGRVPRLVRDQDARPPPRRSGRAAAAGSPRRSRCRGRRSARRPGSAGARRRRHGRSRPAAAARRSCCRGTGRRARRCRPPRARPGRACGRLGCSRRRARERQRDVLDGGEGGDQVEVLEDVADRRTPHPGAAVRAQRREVGALDRDVPDVGLSSPPARVSSVDLPEPDGPMIATSSPACAANETPRSACTAVSPSPWTRVTESSWSTGAVIGWQPFERRPGWWVRARRPVRAAARRSRASQWSSQRISASAAKTSESRTRLQAMSLASCGSAARPARLSRV